MTRASVAGIAGCTPAALTTWGAARGIAVAVGRFSRAPSRTEESAGTRILARSLFERVGLTEIDLGRGASGCPRWPEGWIGSLAHSSGYAMAAISDAGNFTGLGVDIELPSRLTPEMWANIFTARESVALAVHDRVFGKRRAAIAFAAKEAAYKALYPVYPDALGFLDTEVHFSLPDHWLLHVGRSTTLPPGLRISGTHMEVGPMVATVCVVDGCPQA